MATRRKKVKEDPVDEEHDCATCDHADECPGSKEDALAQIAKKVGALIPQPHPTLGMNIHPVGCVRCDSRMHQAMPLGINSELYHCEACGRHSYGPPDAEHTPCNHCNSPTTTHLRTVEADEMIYIGLMCDTCEKNLEADNKLVEAGGVMVRCLTCHTVGVLPPEDARAKRIRKQFKLEGNKSFGVDIPPSGCPRCRGLLARRGFTEDELADIPIDFGKLKARDDETRRSEKQPKPAKAGANRSVSEALKNGCFIAPTTRTQH